MKVRFKPQAEQEKAALRLSDRLGGTAPKGAGLLYLYGARQLPNDFRGLSGDRRLSHAAGYLRQK